MPALLSDIRDPRDRMAQDEMAQDEMAQDEMAHGATGAAAQSVGHRLVKHARVALAAGDEPVAVLMLRLAYESFDRSDRREAA